MGFKFWKKADKKEAQKPPEEKQSAAPAPNRMPPPDFDKELMTAIDGWVESPPYGGPEKLALSRPAGSPEVTVVYSGLVVTGWQDPGHGPEQMHKPGNAKATAEHWDAIIAALRKDLLWYAPDPGPNQDYSGTRLFMRLTLVPKENPGGEQRFVVVGSKHFQGGRIPDEFLNIMNLIAATYPERNILSVAHYD